MLAILLEKFNDFFLKVLETISFTVKRLRKISKKNLLTESTEVPHPQTLNLQDLCVISLVGYDAGRWPSRFPQRSVKGYEALPALCDLTGPFFGLSRIRWLKPMKTCGF